MRILLGTLTLLVAASAAPDGPGLEEQKRKIEALLDSAALLEEAGRPDEAERARAEAAALKKRLAAAREDDDPRARALHEMERAIAALDKAGYEGMAREMRGMAERLRGELKGVRGHQPEGAEFWRSNLETLVIAMKGLSAAGRHDAADMVERAIRARKLVAEGRAHEAAEATRKSPSDGELATLLFKAAGCWREREGGREAAARCEKLGHALQGSIARKVTVLGEQDRGERPDDRMAQLEQRVTRMEQMLHDALERLEARGRERERDQNRERELEQQRELDRQRERERERAPQPDGAR